MKDRDKPRDTPTFNPPIRMTDDGRQVYLRIDLPGIAEEQIRFDLEKTTFTLSIAKDEKTFRKIIRVPKGIRFFKKKFSSGVLEIYLEKMAP